MEEKMYALIIGSVSDYGRDKFVIDPNKPKHANWLIRRATENGFYFDTEEELKVFLGEVVAYAKRLYEERKREKAETVRENDFNEYMNKQ